MDRENLAEVLFKVFKPAGDRRNWKGLSDRGRETWMMNAQRLEQELDRLGSGVYDHGDIDGG